MNVIKKLKVIPNEIKRPDVDVFYGTEGECVWAENKHYKLSYIGHPEREYIQLKFEGPNLSIILDISYGISQKYSGQNSDEYRRSMGIERIRFDKPENRFASFVQAERILGIIAMSVENYPMSYKDSADGKKIALQNQVSFYGVPLDDYLLSSSGLSQYLKWESK